MIACASSKPPSASKVSRRVIRQAPVTAMTLRWVRARPK